MKRLLVIGAGGFIGGFICAEGLRRGFDVTAGLRQSTSRRYLTDPALRFLTLDYASPEALRETFAAVEPFDCVIYNLGATKCARFADFDTVNYRYLVNVVEAMRAAGRLPERFLFMSSLSAMGLGDEKGYTPIRITDTPHPNTRYGLSKMKAEQYLAAQPDVPYTIFRATGVYGPHEKDYLMMIKSIDGHLDVGMGYRRQMLTFIYVDDLVGAMFDALASPAAVRRTYIIAEPRAYTQREFRALVSKALGGRLVLPLKLPMWVVYGVSTLLEKLAAVRGKASTLNRDKYKIMRQRNWSCDVSEAVADFGFHADFPLERGVRATVDAYLADKRSRRRKGGDR